jgi:PAS domain S-box-containing protein
MNREQLLEAFIDSIGQPFVFVDTGHVIRYVSRTAESYYGWAQGDLLGRSIFDFHNPESCRIIREVFASMEKGAEESLITDDAKHRVWMRAVRAPDGELLGCFERYERPADPPAEAGDS